MRKKLTLVIYAQDRNAVLIYLSKIVGSELKYRYWSEGGPGCPGLMKYKFTNIVKPKEKKVVENPVAPVEPPAPAQEQQPEITIGDQTPGTPGMAESVCDAEKINGGVK